MQGDIEKSLANEPDIIEWRRKYVVKCIGTSDKMKSAWFKE
jgi:hypothetical protein